MNADKRRWKAISKRKCPANSILNGLAMRAVKTQNIGLQDQTPLCHREIYLATWLPAVCCNNLSIAAALSNVS